MLDLTHTDLATDEDKSWQLDYWARLFKATTWEELNMLAQNNTYMAEASATVHQLSQEERIRMECEAREDHYRTQLGLQNIMDSQIDQIRSQSAEIESQAAEINALHEWMKIHGYDPAEALSEMKNRENISTK